MRALLLLAGLALVLAAPAAAGAAEPSGTESLLLDAHDTLPDTQPTVTARHALASGHPYTVTVTGTFSIVPAERWLVPVVCGTPAPAPLLPSPGVENGRVGLDAEVQMARTTDRGCSGDYPRRHNRFQIDVGNGFRHLPADGAPFEAAEHGHRYVYRVIGTGDAPRFRIFDTPAVDNYGMLRIEVADAQPQPAGPPATPGVPVAVVPHVKHRCTERRAFTIRVGPRSAVRSATVTVQGRAMHVHYRREFVTARIDLHGTRRARARVRIAIVTTAGRHRTNTRTYRTCARRSSHGA